MREIYRYRLALLQYRMSMKFPFLGWIFKTDLGFCYHFNTFDLGSVLPVLYSLKPLNSGVYWYPGGVLKPRIKLLKQAIELCKKK